MDKYFVEYGALQESTADGPVRVLECDTSAMEARKVPEEFARRICEALNRMEKDREPPKMDDKDLEELVLGVLHGERNVFQLTEDEFSSVLKVLVRVFFARVMNCVDATGRKDKEWLALSDIFQRAVYGKELPAVKET